MQPSHRSVIKQRAAVSERRKAGTQGPWCVLDTAPWAARLGHRALTPTGRESPDPFLSPLLLLVPGLSVPGAPRALARPPLQPLLRPHTGEHVPQGRICSAAWVPLVLR